MFGYVKMIALKENLEDERPDTFVKRKLVDVIEIKDRKEGYVRVCLYLEHGQQVEGWWIKDFLVR